MEVLTLKEAQAAVTSVLKAASDDGGKPVSVAVVDRSGDLVCFACMDGATVRSRQFSMNKAFTAAYMERDSGDFGESLLNSKRTADWYGNPRITGIPGGVTVRKSDFTVGGIGVSGRPSAEDLKLAKLGLAALPMHG
ncbi:MAG: heme-binding protein [Deltaproteobacteria bacterium]|nr:heme-binding protein [Deltaproteobacteria bacterium]